MLMYHRNIITGILHEKSFMERIKGNQTTQEFQDGSVSLCSFKEEDIQFGFINVLGSLLKVV